MDIQIGSPDSAAPGKFVEAAENSVDFVAIASVVMVVDSLSADILVAQWFDKVLEEIPVVGAADNADFGPGQYLPLVENTMGQMEHSLQQVVD